MFIKKIASKIDKYQSNLRIILGDDLNFWYLVSSVGKTLGLLLSSIASISLLRRQGKEVIAYTAQ